MLLVLGTVRLPPENLVSARAAMECMITASRLEKGCEEYGYAEDVLLPGLIHVKEVWQTRADLQCHFNSEHIAAWRATWSALGITDRSLRLYDIKGGSPI